ncbi:hypothetical protein BJY00DRAFT_320248 [Aspergillus carlsbadensis]|nr:hypothetical protein BJY00DRAFT_320248 [Aspergillus carlsbadensis]
MALSNGAIIAIVILACLASVALGASLFGQYNPAEPLAGQRFSRERQMYMRFVRVRNMSNIDRGLRPALPMALSRDVESASSRFSLTTDPPQR